MNGENEESENDEFNRMEIDNGIEVPINAVIRIFYFVTRDDLENCKLVCKDWKRVIDYADRELPPRPVDALILSTNREYSMTFYHGKTKRSYFYKKYFGDRDIDEVEIKKGVSALQEPFDERKFRFPCGDRYPTVSNNVFFRPMDQFHQDLCKSGKPVLYRGSRLYYTKKLFTPPLIYYERLKKMLNKCRIKCLIFHAFTFTDLFVEKAFEFAKDQLNGVDEVVIHGCNFRYISPERFHDLLDGFKAKAYFIERARHCLSNHISKPLLQKSSILRTEVFFVDNAQERRTGNPVIFPIDDEAFMEFATTITQIGLANRKFFGIASCRVSRKVVEFYNRLSQSGDASTSVQQRLAIANSNKQSLNGRWLYKHLRFNDIGIIVEYP